jgi:hypothetical protein
VDGAERWAARAGTDADTAPQDAVTVPVVGVLIGVSQPAAPGGEPDGPRTLGGPGGDVGDEPALREHADRQRPRTVPHAAPAKTRRRAVQQGTDV